MTPQLHCCHPPAAPLLHPSSPSMRINRRKTILPLVFILVFVSLLRVFRLTVSSISFPSSGLVLNTCNQEPSSGPPVIPSKPIHETVPSEKEIRFLFNIILQKSPCNLLVFGLQDQYLKLQIINGGGNTVFLEDRPEKLKKVMVGSNGTRVFRVNYKTYAKDAYKLLMHARSHSSCYPNSGMRSIMSKCKLALTGVPKEVLKTKWDVIVVDGPDGGGPESPGRMGAIFMAGALARAGNGTNVVVHDVDRMIEKWFSWEFLCEENLMSSKGRFWNFRILWEIKTNSRKFCSA